eukprot:366000-Chlamydomonas_euryale.AAC.60
MVPDPDSHASGNVSKDGGDSQGQLKLASVTARAPEAGTRRLTRAAAKATHEAPQPPQAAKTRSSCKASAAPDKTSCGRPPADGATGAEGL